MDAFEQIIPFTLVKSASDYFSPNQCRHSVRNESWRTASFLKQSILLDTEEMTNIRFLEINHFEYGCEMSIYVSECKSGPFIPVCEGKYFPPKKLKRIPISSLPCRFLKIICTKGVHINIKNLKLIGARSEDIASSEDQFELFRLMVANPQRIMYF